MVRECPVLLHLAIGRHHLRHLRVRVVCLLIVWSLVVGGVLWVWQLWRLMTWSPKPTVCRGMPKFIANVAVALRRLRLVAVLVPVSSILPIVVIVAPIVPVIVVVVIIVVPIIVIVIIVAALEVIVIVVIPILVIVLALAVLIKFIY